MRKIIFRGKQLYSCDWVYGDLLNVDSGYDYAIRTFGGKEHGKVNPVYEKTIGQYSGVNDKNGTPMYEGDIIKGAAHWLERYKLAWVGFKDGSFGLFWKRGDVIEFNPFTSLCNVTYEVVGNIFDNDIDNMEVEYDTI